MTKKMNEFKNELKKLLEKYDAQISVQQEENDSFLNLQLEIGNEEDIIDSGYRDLRIAEYNLKIK